MTHYIFIQGKRPDAWELLEKVERADLAKEVFRNYQSRLSGRNHETVAMVEASNMFEGRAKLTQDSSKTSPLKYPYALAPKPWQQKGFDS